MVCAHRLACECSCQPDQCKANPYGELLNRKRHTEMWLAIGVAVSLCAVVFSIGYLALSRIEHQFQMEARV